MKEYTNNRTAGGGTTIQIARLLLLALSILCLRLDLSWPAQVAAAAAAEEEKEWSVDPATGNAVQEQAEDDAVFGNSKDLNQNTTITSSSAEQQQQQQQQQQQHQCSLYLAPSGIPGAGLGVFTGISIEEGEWVGLDPAGIRDLFVPILDPYKPVIPHRGATQRFLSWLGYIWPTDPDTFYPSYHDGSSPDISPAFYPTPQGLNGVTEGPLFFFPLNKVDEEGEPLVINLNAFAPGIASLANSHEELSNIELVFESIECDHTGNDDDDDDNDDDPSLILRQPYTAHHGVSFEALHDIPAGSELYLYYGDLWHQRYEDRVEAAAAVAVAAAAGKQGANYPTLEHYLENEIHNDNFDDRTEAAMRNKRAKMQTILAPKQGRLDEIEAQRRADVDRILRERRNKEAKYRSPPAKSSDTTATTTATFSNSDLQEQRRKLKEQIASSTSSSLLHHDEKQKSTEERPIVQDLEWLETNGACLDHLRVGDSTIAQAGRGAFANRYLSKDSVVAPAPLLALRRHDLKMYAFDSRSEEEEPITLDMSKQIGTELLLNYCYGHPDSELLLVPYTPIVNFINHNSDPTKVNVRIQWPSDEKSQLWLQRLPQNWLDEHPLDVTDQSGKLMMEFVALRDIEAGEEIFMSYGLEWQTAWDNHCASNIEKDKGTTFRHEIGVPDGFFPSNWLNQVMEFELAPIESIRPGELVPLTWKHNGEPISKSAFVVGLPEGFAEHVKAFADERGINSLYEQLLAEPVLGSDEWFVFDADQHENSDREGETEQWFAQRFKTESWGLNVHYIGPWNRAARTSLFRNFGSGGFDLVLESIGNQFGLESITCFLESFIGVSQARNSFMHTDVYATGEKGFNILFPIITVNGSHPELDIQSDNADRVVSVKYEHDRAVVLTDWGYHRTSTVAYDETQGQVRVVVGLYCAQLDETNHKMLKYIYTGEPPAPFYDQFNLPIKEYQWGKGHHLPK